MERILIVDDQVELLNGLAVNLRREGYEVLTATEGEAALSLALPQPRQGKRTEARQVLKRSMTGSRRGRALALVGR